MNKFELANQWIALLTNIGVLLGIFVLIYEIRQNTVSIENQTDVAVAEIASSQATLVVMDPDLAALVEQSTVKPWSEFSAVEQLRLGVFWGMLVDRVGLQRSLLERSGYQLTRDKVYFPETIVRNESFRAWWSMSKQDGTYSEAEQEFFDSYIDSVLRDHQ